MSIYRLQSELDSEEYLLVLPSVNLKDVELDNPTVPVALIFSDNALGTLTTRNKYLLAELTYGSGGSNFDDVPTDEIESIIVHHTGDIVDANIGDIIRYEGELTTVTSITGTSSASPTDIPLDNVFITTSGFAHTDGDALIITSSNIGGRTVEIEVDGTFTLALSSVPNSGNVWLGIYINSSLSVEHGETLIGLVDITYAHGSGPSPSFSEFTMADSPIAAIPVGKDHILGSGDTIKVAAWSTNSSIQIIECRLRIKVL